MSSVELFIQLILKQNLLWRLTWSHEQNSLSQFDFNMQRHFNILLQRSSLSDLFSNLGELSYCTIIWNFQKMYKNNTWLWQNTRTKASKCRPDNDHPSQKIRIPIIWKHVLNDSSKTVETFPSKMAELLTITTEFIVFTSESHFNANIWSEKKNGKQNDF